MKLLNYLLTGISILAITCCNDSEPDLTEERGTGASDTTGTDTTSSDTTSTDTLVLSRVYLVSSASDITALPELLPGDTIMLEDGDWVDQNIVFTGEGIEGTPIYLLPQTKNGVVLLGNSTLSIGGNYLQVEGLVFANGTASGNVIEFRKGSITSNYCRLSEVTIENYSPTDNSVNSKWISLYGTHNRVDHCSLSGKTNVGTTLVVWMDETPDHHQIDHNYFGERPELGENGGETIRIGTSAWVEYNSNTTVEYNLFEECDGELEIISNKSVGNTYRYNTFRGCNGTLTLRHGSYCEVYGNFFLGDENKKCGGVRIIGEGHKVYNNYFENLYGTSYRAAISLVNGEVDAASSGYVQVTNAEIGFNTIVNCKQPFAIGAGANSERILPPSETTIANNLIKGKSGYNMVYDYDETTGIDWYANYAEVSDLGIDPVEGITTTSFSMVEEGGIYRLISSSPLIGAADVEVMEYVLVDIDGQQRTSTSKDVGCDQLTTGEITVYPLTPEDCIQ